MTKAVIGLPLAKQEHRTRYSGSQHPGFQTRQLLQIFADVLSLKILPHLSVKARTGMLPQNMCA